MHQPLPAILIERRDRADQRLDVSNQPDRSCVAAAPGIGVESMIRSTEPSNIPALTRNLAGAETRPSASRTKPISIEGAHTARSHGSAKPWLHPRGRSEGQGEIPVSRPVPDRARQLAAELEIRFAQDAKLARRLNDVHQRIRRAIGRCGGACILMGRPQSTASIPLP
jgi:hypothetical protein